MTRAIKLAFIFLLFPLLTAEASSYKSCLQKSLLQILKIERQPVDLRVLGYSEKITHKLLQNESLVAWQIMKNEVPQEISKSIQYRRVGKPTVKPVTVYRGLAIDVEKFDPAFKGKKWASENEIFVAPELEIAAAFGSVSSRVEAAKASGQMSRNSIIIVEYEVPDYLINRSRGYDLLQSGHFNNQENFIKRIGVLNLEDAPKSIKFPIQKVDQSRIKWIDY